MSKILKQETIEFGHGSVELTMTDRIIYLKIDGEWHDDDVFTTIKRLESYFEELGVPTVRVWDATRLDHSNFKLTPDSIRIIGQWAERIKNKWPGHTGYFIGGDPLVYGLTRMYELRNSDEKLPIHVLSNFDELPDEVMEYLSELNT